MELHRSRCNACGRIAFEPIGSAEPCFRCNASEGWTPCPAEPLETSGMPNIVPDHINKYFDLASGQWINSRTERKRIYKEMGLSRVSVGEWRRQNGGMEHRRTVTYGGMTNHQSSAERNG